jgi:non-heme chloroperoxidase
MKPMSNVKSAYLTLEPGVELYYEEAGQGSPIVFIPGWTFNGTVFEHQVAHFSKTHRVITIDPRGQGRSTKTVHGVNYDTQGADVAKLIDALGLEDVVLVGWSTGSLTNLSYAKAAGTGKLKGVVGIDMSPKALSVDDTDWVEGPLDEIAGAFKTFLGSPQGQRDFISWYATEVMVQRELNEQELEWLVGQSAQTPYYIAALLFADAMYSDYREQATQVSEAVPTHYVVAEHWAETAVPFLNKNFPKITTSVLGGHLMFWEHSEKFNEILEKFFENLA